MPINASMCSIHSNSLAKEKTIIAEYTIVDHDRRTYNGSRAADGRKQRGSFN
jgi:hypothetical protein